MVKNYVIIDNNYVKEDEFEDDGFEFEFFHCLGSMKANPNTKWPEGWSLDCDEIQWPGKDDWDGWSDCHSRFDLEYDESRRTSPYIKLCREILAANMPDQRFEAWSMNGHYKMLTTSTFMDPIEFRRLVEKALPGMTELLGSGTVECDENGSPVKVLSRDSMYYRYMGREEFEKMLSGDVIEGRDHSETAYTTANGVCFWAPSTDFTRRPWWNPEKLLQYRYTPFGGCYGLLSEAYHMAGRKFPELFVSFCATVQLTEAKGTYPSPFEDGGGFYGGPTITVSEYTIPSYTRETMIPISYTTTRSWSPQREENEWRSIEKQGEKNMKKQEEFVYLCQCDPQTWYECGGLGRETCENCGCYRVEDLPKDTEPGNIPGVKYAGK